jgi:hypothetical protein
MLLLVEDRTLDAVVALLKEETSIVCPLFIVATQFLIHVLINFQKNPKIAKNTLKIQKIHF